MATPRDLVEAQSFERRRLVTAWVTAFVPGAPRGREARPGRPGRVLVGGLALALLLVAAAAVAHVLHDHDRGRTGSAVPGWGRVAHPALDKYG